VEESGGNRGEAKVHRDHPGWFSAFRAPLGYHIGSTFYFYYFLGFPPWSPGILADLAHTTLVTYYVLSPAPSTRDRLGRKTLEVELYRVYPGWQSCFESTQPIGVWAPWTCGAGGSSAGDLGRVIIYVSVPVQLEHLIHLRHLGEQGGHWLQ
jgi:hypothetical protein